jgi:hypothetical protein
LSSVRDGQIEAFPYLTEHPGWRIPHILRCPGVSYECHASNCREGSVRAAHDQNSIAWLGLRVMMLLTLLARLPGHEALQQALACASTLTCPCLHQTSCTKVAHFLSSCACVPSFGYQKPGPASPPMHTRHIHDALNDAGGGMVVTSTSNGAKSSTTASHITTASSSSDSRRSVCAEPAAHWSMKTLSNCN